MKKNMGTIDKSIRVAVALIVGILYYLGIVSGTLGIILMVFALIMVLTSVFSFCPLYLPFGINTCCADKCCGGSSCCQQDGNQ